MERERAELKVDSFLMSKVWVNKQWTASAIYGWLMTLLIPKATTQAKQLVFTLLCWNIPATPTLSLGFLSDRLHVAIYGLFLNMELDGFRQSYGNIENTFFLIQVIILNLLDKYMSSLKKYIQIHYIAFTLYFSWFPIYLVSIYLLFKGIINPKEIRESERSAHIK